MIAAIERFGQFVNFGLEAVGAIPAALAGRRAEVLRQFERVAWGGLPIAATAGVCIGLVTWIQNRRLLATYGSEALLPSVLAVAVLVEIGPLLAGLLVAGRMGAGLAAELASMVLTEEVDARTVLGAGVVPTLVAPRAIACALAVPFLTVVLDAAALGGALGAELTAGTLSAEVFQARSLDFLRLSTVGPATLKTAAFGLLVGLIGTWTGLAADRSTESVGKAATRGVVRSMLAVFGANVALVPWIQAAVDALGWTS